MSRTRIAIVGSGNIGTDLMLKCLKSEWLECAVVAGIDPESPGLELARTHRVATTSDGIEGLMAHPAFADVEIVCDATSATAHVAHDARLRGSGRRLVDLTPAAVGPFVVPVVNLDAHRDAVNVNMISCGGQATIPIVAAIGQIARVHYAEIVASIASRSAGPGTRANIDEFTQTTALGLERVGGARHSKAIIVLNPAEPPLLMRSTVFVCCSEADRGQIAASVARMVESVKAYVPGYRLKQAVQVEPLDDRVMRLVPGAPDGPCLKVSVFLEVEGAADFLPRYAGNLDVMTSAARAVCERMAREAMYATMQRSGREGTV